MLQYRRPLSLLQEWGFSAQGKNRFSCLPCILLLTPRLMTRVACSIVCGNLSGCVSLLQSTENPESCWSYHCKEYITPSPRTKNGKWLNGSGWCLNIFWIVSFFVRRVSGESTVRKSLCWRLWHRGCNVRDILGVICLPYLHRRQRNIYVSCVLSSGILTSWMIKSGECWLQVLCNWPTESISGDSRLKSVLSGMEWYWSINMVYLRRYMGSTCV